MAQGLVNGGQQAAKRILIIEDDAVVARLYQNRLRKEGYRVEIATEGQEGFFTILKDKPDGVLLDLMLPNMDGIQILRKTRAQKQFEAMPIIVFSNSYINGMLDEAVAAGANRVFNKSDPGTTQNIVAGFMEEFFPSRLNQPRSAPAPAPAPAYAPSAPADPPHEPAPHYDQRSAQNGDTMMFRRDELPSVQPPSELAGTFARPFTPPTPRFGAIPKAKPTYDANGAIAPVRPPSAPPAAPAPFQQPPPPPPPPTPSPPLTLRMAGGASAPVHAQAHTPLPAPPPPAPLPTPPPVQPAPPQASGQTIFVARSSPLLPSLSSAPGPIVPPDDTSFGPSVPGIDSIPEEFIKVFFESGPETMSGVRKSLRAYSKEPATAAGQAQLNGFYRKVHSLTGSAGMAGLESIGNYSACLEAFLRELLLNPVAFQPSSLRTLASAVDLLALMFDQGPGYHCKIPASPVVMVVDDDVISRRAVTFGLEKASLKSVGTADPHHALAELSKNVFELIFLDVDMPDMDGFELCSRIRSLPAYAATPVVFITGMSDFHTRAKSITSGGNDFISKPLCFIELAVKALTFVLKGRIALSAHSINPRLL